MSVLMTMRMRGDAKRLEEVAQRDPDQLREIVEDASRHGLISHHFWATGEDLMVVDEWPDERACQEFFEADDARIHAVMDSAGVTGEPEVSFWHRLETHDDFERGQDTLSTMFQASFAEADEVRPYEGGTGRMELVQTPQGPIGRGIYEPGWRWSEHVRPIVGTDSCEIAHAGYMVSGRLRVRTDDGAEREFRGGDVLAVPPGHDAWVVGDEPCVLIDWQGAATYARR